MAPVSFQFQASQVTLSASITTKYVSPAVMAVPGTVTVVRAQQLPKTGLGGALMNPDKLTPGAPPTSSTTDRGPIVARYVTQSYVNLVDIAADQGHELLGVLDESRSGITPLVVQPLQQL